MENSKIESSSFLSGKVEMMENNVEKHADLLEKTFENVVSLIARFDILSKQIDDLSPRLHILEINEKNNIIYINNLKNITSHHESRINKLEEIYTTRSGELNVLKKFPIIIVTVITLVCGISGLLFSYDQHRDEDIKELSEQKKQSELEIHQKIDEVLTGKFKDIRGKNEN